VRRVRIRVGPLAPADRRWLLAIVAVAAVLRVAWCLWAARPPSAQLHDPNFYLLYGEQLASGNGYRLPLGEPTAYYPPGYPFSLVPFFWLLEHTPLPDTGEVATVAALNIVWQLAMIVVVFELGRRLTGRALAGLVAAGLLALWPNLVFHTAVALTESLFLLLLVAALLLAVAAPWEERRWEPWRLAAVGAVLGAATLVRPVTVPVFPLLLVVLLVARFGWRRAIGHTALVCACAAAVLLPWLVRNVVVMDAVALSTNTGDNLCMSRRVGGSGGFELPNDRCFPARFNEIPRPESEILRDRHGRELALEFVREHPAEELRLVLRRLGRTFEDDADGIAAVESYGTDPWLADGTRSLLRGVATGYGLVAGVVALPGLWLLGRRSPAGLLVVLTGLGMLAPPLLFFGDPRFHVPVVPVAALAVGAVATAVRPARAPAAPPTAPAP
jgi:4-amino-4-deoxy-L-arabinose transferase-like glycosyltransferase